MGCGSSSSTKDVDEFDISHKSNTNTTSRSQDNASSNNASTPSHVIPKESKKDDKLEALKRIFNNVDNNISVNEFNLWLKAISIYYEEYLLNYDISTEENIIKVAYLSNNPSVEDIKPIDIKKLMESSKQANLYIALTKYKLSKSGWLHKQGHFVKNWRRRYFHLFEGSIKYYASDTYIDSEPQDMTKPKGEITLTSTTKVVENLSLNKSSFIIQIDGVPSSNDLWIDALTEGEKIKWMHAIEEQILIMGVCKKLNINPGNFLDNFRCEKLM